MRTFRASVRRIASAAPQVGWGVPVEPAGPAIHIIVAEPAQTDPVDPHGNVAALERLNPDDLSEWLDKYQLGELWTQGELGGTRW